MMKNTKETMKNISKDR